MCCRYYLDVAIDKEPYYEAGEARGATRETRDICPGDEASGLVVASSGIRRMAMKWGFINPRGGLIINARIENMRQRPMFSALADRQRVALPASGYYEWRKGDKQRFGVSVYGVDRVFLAGLYRQGERGLEFVVLTQPPMGGIGSIHNRMPVILWNEDAVRRWLGGEDVRFEEGERLTIRALGDEQLRMPF